MNQNQIKNGERKLPDWYTGGRVHELGLIEYLRSSNYIRYVEGRFYQEDGTWLDEHFLRQWIVRELSRAGITCGLSRKSKEILDLMRVHCYYEPPKPGSTEIFVQNGKLDLSSLELDETPCFVLNRLPVPYDPAAPHPRYFQQFLDQLLEEEDQKTLQEYLGYCLIPTNRAQKMLLLVGKGGEGKSTLGRVICKLWGKAAMSGSIQKISTNQFARADLEGKLVMIDDDMSMEALTQTHYFKTLITLEGETDLEKKGRQSYQGRIYARFLGFSNGMLSALYDHSLAFYRRQIVLQVKERPKDRRDDPFVAEDLFAELPGILNWCIAGLHRLVSNDFRFTVSTKTKAFMETQIRDSNTVLCFLESEGYLVYDPQACISSADFYEVYRRYCEENSMTAVAAPSFHRRLAPLAKDKHLTATTHLPTKRGKSVRGYLGVRAAMPPNW